MSHPLLNIEIQESPSICSLKRGLHISSNFNFNSSIASLENENLEPPTGNYKPLYSLDYDEISNSNQDLNESYQKLLRKVHEVLNDNGNQDREPQQEMSLLDKVEQVLNSPISTTSKPQMVSEGIQTTFSNMDNSFTTNTSSYSKMIPSIQPHPFNGTHYNYSYSSSNYTPQNYHPQNFNHIPKASSHHTISLPKIDYKSILCEDEDSFIEDQIKNLAKKYSIQESFITNQSSICQSDSNMSANSLEYLSKYGLQQNTKVLDRNRIQNLPKLRHPGVLRESHINNK